MGSAPNWTYGYVPTAAEWAYQFSTKQDDLDLSAQTTQTLQFGVGVANGLASLDPNGQLQPAQFPALTGDVTTTAGALATAVVKIGGKAISLANSFTTSGNFAVTITATGTTNITLPTSGTLMANPMTTSGDIIYGGASGVPTRLAVGTNGFVLTLAAGVPVWSSTGAGNVVLSGTPSNGQMAQWISSSQIQGVATTGSGNAVLATGPTISNAIVGTQSPVDNSTKAASTAYVATSFANYDPGGFVNKFRNIGFSVAQRGTSGTITTGNTSYSLDGWLIAPTGATASWSQQYNANLTGNALRIACATGMTALNVLHRIESYIASDLLAYAKTAQAITVQFAIYNNTGASLTVTLNAAYATSQDAFGSVTGDLSTTNMQTITNATAGIVAYTFTPSANLANGYRIILGFAGQLNAGSGYVDIGYADIRATPSVSTGLNSNPPPFERRAVASDTAFCQRYYWDPANGGATTAFAANTFGTSSGAFSGALIYLPVTMRATPGSPTLRNQAYTNASSVAVTPVSPSTATCTVTQSATGAASAAFNMTVSAEL